MSRSFFISYSPADNAHARALQLTLSNLSRIGLIWVEPDSFDRSERIRVTSIGRSRRRTFRVGAQIGLLRRLQHTVTIKALAELVNHLLCQLTSVVDFAPSHLETLRKIVEFESVGHSRKRALRLGSLPSSFAGAMVMA